MDVFLKKIKEHFIDIMTRINPSKKSYQMLMWEDRKMDEVLTTQMKGVYQDSEACDYQDEILFQDYISEILAFCKKIMNANSGLG